MIKVKKSLIYLALCQLRPLAGASLKTVLKPGYTHSLQVEIFRKIEDIRGSAVRPEVREPGVKQAENIFFPNQRDTTVTQDLCIHVYYILQYGYFKDIKDQK
jgi:hypothetical protein